jgi:hypothetical protein
MEDVAGVDRQQSRRTAEQDCEKVEGDGAKDDGSAPYEGDAGKEGFEG